MATTEEIMFAHMDHSYLNLSPDPDEDDPVEDVDWADEDDEDFDDKMEDLNDLHEIRVDDDLLEPGPEEDDHLPDDDLQ